MNATQILNGRNVRLLLIGNPGVVHIGAHLANAAAALGISVRHLDLTAAWASNVWINRFHWHLSGRRPVHLGRFSRFVLETCRSYKPTVILATGIAPINVMTLQEIRGLDIPTCNYLTDDPFNPAHRAPWFLSALPNYDCIFSPRRANIPDLQAFGCRNVSYMPFAYAPEVHYPECLEGRTEAGTDWPDVFFAGHADVDRIPYMTALIRARFHLALYGGGWDRYRATRRIALGCADPRTARRAAATSKVSMCLVRRANRDGHSMRSYELPAMRACMAVEDTPEHREMFGPPGESALFFQTPEELVALVRRLEGDDAARSRLAEACHARISNGANTYRDRLIAMLTQAEVVSESPQHAQV